MFSSLLRRPRNGPRRVDRRHDSSASPSPGPAHREYEARRHATADFTEADDDGDDSNEEGANQYENQRNQAPEEEEEGGEDGRPRTALPVLPLFSASHLGMSSQLPCVPFT